MFLKNKSSREPFNRVVFLSCTRPLWGWRMFDSSALSFNTDSLCSALWFWCMLDDCQIKQQRTWLNAHIHCAPCKIQSKSSFFFIFINLLMWFIGWFCFAMFFQRSTTESQFPISSVDGELFVSHCTKLLTLRKKETLLETFVFRHAFRKMPLASLVARNLSCSRNPIIIKVITLLSCPCCCYATAPYAFSPQGSRQADRKMEENLTSISYLWRDG